MAPRDAGTGGEAAGGRLLRPAYLHELDTLRGLAVATVVAVHVSLPLMEREGLGGWDHLGAIAVNQLGRFSVPAFLFISGLLITYRQAGLHPRPAALSRAGLRAWGAMLHRRAAGILVPYLFWSLAGLVASGWAAALKEDPSWALRAMLTALLLGQNTYYQLYFVPLVFEMYLLAPLVHAAQGSGDDGRRRWRVAVGAMALQAAVVGVHEAVLDGWLTPPEGWMPVVRMAVRISFPAWIGYFVAGMAVGDRYDAFTAWLARLSGRGLLAAWAASAVVLVVDYTSSLRPREAPSGGSADFMRLEVILYAVLSVLLLLRHARRWRGLLAPGEAPCRAARGWGSLLVRALGLLGQYSFGIYLVHLFVLRSMGETGSTLRQSWDGAIGLSLVVLGLSLVLAYGLARLPLGWVVAGRPTRRPRAEG